MKEQRNIYVREGMNPFTGESTYFVDLGALLPPTTEEYAPRCRIKIDPDEAANSHFFGVPRIEYDWPTGPNGPLDCLLSIKCSDVPSQLSNLPESGWLNVFYDLGESDWGHSPSSKRFWHIAWSAEDCSLAEIPRDYEVSDAVPVLLEFEELHQDSGPTHALGGTADWVQNDIRPMAHFQSGYFLRHKPTVEALTEAGLNPESLTTDDSKKFTEAILKLDQSEVHPDRFYEGVTEWQLFLQIDSDDDLDLMWGDVGKLYVVLPTQSLAERNFADAWINVQCY